MGTRRVSNAGVLEAPEDMYASENAYSQPAPAGSLRRDFDADEDARAEASGESYPGRRSGGTRSPGAKGPGARGAKGLRLRFRSLPRTLGGRIAAGTAALVVLGAFGVSGLLIRQYLLHSERFLLKDASSVEVLGNHQLTRVQALSVFSGDLDRNIFHMSLQQRETDLERLPWVQHATVMRLLPNRLRVSIVERTPVAFVRQGTQIGLVDASGVLLDMPSDAAGDPHYSFPVLTGIGASDPLSTRKARMELYTSFMKAMAAGGEQVTDNLSEVDVTDPEDVKAVVARDGSDILVHFGDEDFLNRYQTFDQHLAEWRQMYPKLVSADMRYASQIVLNSGTAAPPAAVSATGPSAADAAAVALAASGAAQKPAVTIPAKMPGTPAAASHPPAAPHVAAKPHPITLNRAAHPAKKTAATHAKAKPAHHAGGLQR